MQVGTITVYSTEPRVSATEANVAPDVLPRITAQKVKFSIKDFFSKCGQIRRKLRFWSHILKKSLMENFIFCTVNHKHCNNNSEAELSYKDSAYPAAILEKNIAIVYELSCTEERIYFFLSPDQTGKQRQSNGTVG